MSISFRKKFSKSYDKASDKIKKVTKEKIALFEREPFHPSLNNHALIGQYQGSRSINITGDWRAIYSETIENGEKVITFIELGTHSQLYK